MEDYFSDLGSVWGAYVSIAFSLDDAPPVTAFKLPAWRNFLLTKFGVVCQGVNLITQSFFVTHLCWYMTYSVKAAK